MDDKLTPERIAYLKSFQIDPKVQAQRDAIARELIASENSSDELGVKNITSIGNDRPNKITNADLRLRGSSDIDSPTLSANDYANAGLRNVAYNTSGRGERVIGLESELKQSSNKIEVEPKKEQSLKKGERVIGLYSELYPEEKPKVAQKKHTTENSSFSDFVVGAGQGVNQGLKMVTDVFGTDNSVSELLADNTRIYDSMYSDKKKQQDIANEYERKALGEDASFLDKAWLAMKQSATNPSMLGQGVGQVVPMLSTGLMGIGSKGIGVVAAMQGAGSAKSNIADNILNADESVLLPNPDYAKMRETMGEKEAKQALATKLQSYGENGLLIAANAAIGAGMSRVGAEKYLGTIGGDAGLKALQEAAKNTTAKGLLKTTGKEVGTEVIQEPVDQFIGNVGAAKGGANIDATQGLAEASGSAAVQSILPSAGMSYIAGRNAQSQLTNQQQLSRGQRIIEELKRRQSELVNQSETQPTTQDAQSNVTQTPIVGGEAINASDILDMTAEDTSNVSNITEPQATEVATETTGAELDNQQGSTGNTLSEPTIGGLDNVTEPLGTSGTGDIQRGVDESGVGNEALGELPSNPRELVGNSDNVNNTLNNVQNTQNDVNGEQSSNALQLPVNDFDVIQKSEGHLAFIPATKENPAVMEVVARKDGNIGIADVGKAIDTSTGNRFTRSQMKDTPENRVNFLKSLGVDYNPQLETAPTLSSTNAPLTPANAELQQVGGEQLSQNTENNNSNLTAKQKLAQRKKKNKPKTFISHLKGLGGIRLSDKKEITGEASRLPLGGYGRVFRRDAKLGLQDLIDDGALDDYLPYEMRASTSENLRPNEVYDSQQAYEYLADRIGRGENPFPYEVELEAKEKEYNAQAEIEQGSNLLSGDEINALLREAGYDEREESANSRIYEAGMGETVEETKPTSATSDIISSERAQSGNESNTAQAQNEITGTPSGTQSSAGIQGTVSRVIALKTVAKQLRKPNQRGFDTPFEKAVSLANGEVVAPDAFRMAQLLYRPKSSLNTESEKEFLKLSALTRLSQTKKDRLRELQSDRTVSGGNQELSDLFGELHQIAKERYNAQPEVIAKKAQEKESAGSKATVADTLKSEIESAKTQNELDAILRKIEDLDIGDSLARTLSKQLSAKEDALFDANSAKVKANYNIQIERANTEQALDDLANEVQMSNELNDGDLKALDALINAKIDALPEMEDVAESEATISKKETVEDYSILKKQAYSIASKLFGNDIYSNQIQNDWQNLLDATDAKDVDKLKKLAFKYQADTGRGMTSGTGGAGPGKVKQARPGAAQLGYYAQLIGNSISKEQNFTLQPETNAEILAREQAQKDAEADKARAEAKAKADSEREDAKRRNESQAGNVDNFTFGESSKEAAKPQRDMFGGTNNTVTLPEQGADKASFSVRAKSDDVRDMFAQHNISEEGLFNADKVGGLAVPSLAVTKADLPLENFGEITLIAPKTLIDPKAGRDAKVFGADIYSTRYPEVTYQFNNKSIDAFNDKLKESYEATNSRPIRGNDLDRNAVRTLKDEVAIKHAFLKSVGENANVVYTKPDDEQVAMLNHTAIKPFVGGTTDPYDLSNNVDFVNAYYEYLKDKRKAEGKRTVDIDFESKQNIVRNDGAYEFREAVNASKAEVDKYRTKHEFDKVIEAKYVNEFNDYVNDLFDSLSPDEKLFEGYTYSGNRRYSPHTLDNVVKKLKKNLRGGENWNYGLGSVRSKFTPEFKSIAEIKKNKYRIISTADFEAVKAEQDAEFMDLANRFGEYHDNSEKFGYLDTFTATMSDAATMGVNRALQENQFKDVPENLKQDLAEFLTKLHNMPTEYFEAKVTRAVGLDEFVGAIVPDKISQKALGILKKNGIEKVYTYSRTEGNRAKVIQKALAELRDSALFSRTSQPIFYSQLSRAIDTAKFDSVSPTQWKLWLAGNAPKLGVKKDEIEWTGINEWLSLQTGKVSKADIQAYLDGNGVQVANDVLKKVGGGKVSFENLNDGTLYEDGDGNSSVVEMPQNVITITPEMREKIAGGLPLFSKQTSTEKTLTASQVKDAIANDIYNQEVDVYETLAQAPQYIQAQARSEGAYGVEGYFDKRTNRVALIASNLESLDRAVEVARHELIGHYGIENMMPAKEFDDLLSKIKIARRFNPDLKDITNYVLSSQPALKITSQDNAEQRARKEKRIAKEVIAVMAERNLQNNLYTRIVDAVRKFLTKLGIINKDVTDAEIRTQLRKAQQYLSENGRNIVEASDSNFSQNSNTKQEYEQRIDELFSGEKANFAKLGVKVLDKSDMLDMLGYGNKPIYLNESKVIDGKLNHGLKAEHWKKIPEWLDNPALVFESDTVAGRLVMIAPKKVNNAPVRMIVEPDAENNGLKINLLVNAYDAQGKTPFSRWIDEGLLRYYSKAKSPVVLTRSELQLLGMAKPRGRGIKILRDADLVKYRAENSLSNAKDTNFFGRSVAPLAIKAYESLSFDAKRAIDNWNVNWDVSELAKANTAIYDEIYQAYQPVRDRIKRTYGDSIELYRGEKAGGEKSDSTRKLYSWTPSQELARKFGKGVKSLPRRITQTEVDNAVKKFNSTGYAQIAGYKYVKQNNGYALYDKDNQYITGGYLDEVEQDIQQSIDDKNEYVDRLDASGIVRKELINVDDIAFIPVNKNISMPEFVVHVGKTIPDTITVNGKSRPTRNSNGQLIHPTIEGIEKFWEWFGDSKVVDAEGKPMVVYHGTRDEFDTFNTSGINRLAFFTDNKEVAKDYGKKLTEAYLKIEDLEAADFYGGWWKDNYGKAERLVGRVNQGYIDGLLYENTKDPKVFDSEKEYKVSNIYAVKNPSFIKSATNNNGNFDGNNDSILFSRGGGSRNTQENLFASWDNLESSGFTTDLIYNLQDKYIDLKDVIKSIKKNVGEIADRFNPYLQEELYHQRVADRVKDFSLNELEPLLTAMNKANVSMPDLEHYLHARHAPERNAQMAKINPDNPDMQDGGSGMTNQEAQDYIDSIPQDLKETLDVLAAQVDAINKRSRDIAMEYGIEDIDTVMRMEDTYQFYVPLMRDLGGDVEGFGTGAGYSIRGNSTKRAMGSQKDVVDILANIAAQREKFIVRGEKNRVATALVGLAATNQNKDFWTVDNPPKLRYINKSTGFVEEAVDPNYKSKNNVVVARILDKNGKVQERAVVFNETDKRAVRLAESLKNLDVDGMEYWMRSMSSVTRYFAAVNTQYNPVFGVVNLVRDLQGAAINLSSTEIADKKTEVMTNALPAMMAIAKTLRAERNGKALDTDNEWVGYWKRFTKGGGKTGYREMFASAKDRTKALNKTVDPMWWSKTKFGRLISFNNQYIANAERFIADKANAWVFEILSDYNETLENAVRLSAFKSALDKGLTEQQALSLAKNLTVNFNRKGAYGARLGALYAFFNASAQGSARMAETIMKDGKVTKMGARIIAGGMALGVMQALLLSGYDDNDPPEFERDRNIIIPIGNGKYAKMPMPLGFHVLPSTARKLVEFMSGKNQTTAELILSLGELYADAFNPIGGGTLSQILSPTVTDPIVALGENKDNFGRTIYQEKFNPNDTTAGHLRVRNTSTALGQAIAHGINALSGGSDYTAGAISPTPDQIDFLIEQATGGVGRELTKAGNMYDAYKTGKELPTNKVVLLGRFYGNANSNYSKGNTFYKNLELMDRHKRELQGRREDGLDVTDYLKENPEAKLWRQAQFNNTVIKKLRDKKEKLIANGAPAIEIKNVENRIAEIEDRFNTLVKNVSEKSQPVSAQ